MKKISSSREADDVVIERLFALVMQELAFLTCTNNLVSRADLDPELVLSLGSRHRRTRTLASLQLLQCSPPRFLVSDACMRASKVVLGECFRLHVGLAPSHWVL